MSKAYAILRNTTAQTVADGGAVNPGAAVHGFGCACGGRAIQVNGNGILLRESGYYEIIVGATVTDSDAGNVTMSVLQDGNVVGSGSTVIAAAADPGMIAFPAGVKVNCNAVITIEVTASTGSPTVSAIYTTVKKV